MAGEQRLFFVRHGQTDFSKEDRFTGEIDIPLNETGKAMAEALGAYYASTRWEAIYSSPKLRARQTAEPLCRRTGLPMRIEDGLREIAYGKWDARLADEVEQDDPELYRKWEADPGRHAPPGGETGIQIAERALASVNAIRDRHPSGKVMIVSHKATIRVLVCALLGIDVGLFRARIGMRVASVTQFSFRKSGPRLDVLGDIGHLPPELHLDVGT